MKKNAIIYYHPGAYGTFVEWCLNYFSDLEFSNNLPFTKTGNAHKFEETLPISSEKMFHDAINKDIKFMRMHPGSTSKQAHALLVNYKGIAADCYRSELKLLENFTNNIVVVYFGLENVLWGSNNIIKSFNPKNEVILDYLRKNEVPDLEMSFSEDLHDYTILKLTKTSKKHAKRWDKDSINDMEVWELREFLSLYSYGEWANLYQGLETLNEEFTNTVFLEIGQLRDNFEQTIIDLLERLDLPLVRDNFDYVYNNWSNVQKFKFKDREIKEIVQATVNGNDLHWGELSIIDEAEIQRQLRENGWEIRCFGINNFPTSSAALKLLLYKNQ
jgi:hypothetical protein